jgi:hypothetical protein
MLMQYTHTHPCVKLARESSLAGSTLGTRTNWPSRSKPPWEKRPCQREFHHPGDPLEPVPTEPFRELSLGAGGELREVGAEEPLQGADSPAGVGALRRGMHGEGHLICHTEMDRPKELAACSPWTFR